MKTAIPLPKRPVIVQEIVPLLKKGRTFIVSLNGEQYFQVRAQNGNAALLQVLCADTAVSPTGKRQDKGLICLSREKAERLLKKKAR